MDFDESKRKPPSLRSLLYKQAEEQSDLCDVTIKHGLWEKTFHWCVLVASPFFENIRKHSYRERDTGIIAIHVGTNVSLEEAIWYLYGKKPKIKFSNIAALLEIAEYLMISGLKAACVRWIKRAKITDENCLDMIKLASLYQFSLSSYDEYLKGRLPDLMQMDEMMDLTVESVEYILEDANLVHIKARDKFSFLVRWTKSRQNRKAAFEQFLKHIDFADMERSFITNVVMKERMVHELDMSSSFIAQLESLEKSPLSSCEILVFPDKYSDNKLPCYDMDRRRWCSLSIGTKEERPDILDKSLIRNIVNVRGKHSSEAYCYDRSFDKACVYIINFENSSVKRSDVNYAHDHGNNREKKYVHNDELIVIFNEEAEPHSVKSTANISRFEKGRYSVSQLNVGKIENDVTSTVPILSLKGTVSQVCANKTTIAMLQCDTHLLFLYDRKYSSFKTIDLKEKQIHIKISDVLVKAGDDFVIYNNSRVVSISKQNGQSLLNNYQINQYNLCRRFSDICQEFYFCENRWYRSYTSVQEVGQVFESTTHEKFMVAVQDQGRIPDEIWEDLTVYSGYEHPGKNIFHIKVSKDRLSCALQCPHCKLQRADEIQNGGDDDDDCSSLYFSDEYYDSDYDYDHDFVSLEDVFECIVEL